MKSTLPFKIAKFLTLIFWVLVIYSLFDAFPFPDMAPFLTYIGVIALFAHALEILIFRDRLRAQDNIKTSALKALVFGMFEILTWKR